MRRVRRLAEKRGVAVETMAVPSGQCYRFGKGAAPVRERVNISVTRGCGCKHPPHTEVDVVGGVDLPLLLGRSFSKISSLR